MKKTKIILAMILFLLSFNGLRHPRPEQRRRIVEGVHQIGRELLSVVFYGQIGI